MGRRVIWNLLRRANEDRSGQLWSSMSDVLPLLAEAAPDVFLRAVAEAASGPEPLIRKLFQDQGDAWHASSPHTGLLWALECIAWSRQHLGFAAELLATLAEIDPGGRLSNRPAESLRNIFRPWIPQTSAPAETRIMILDSLLRRHKDVTWDLLIALLPERLEVAMQAYKPLFRDWPGDGEQSITHDEFASMVNAISERIIHLAKQEPAQWIDVIPRFARLPEARRRESVSALEALSHEALNDKALIEIWHAIEEFVRRHRQYPDADWSLTEEWLAPLAAVGERLRPRSATDRHRWLFDSWHPDIGVTVRGNFTAFKAQLQRMREEAIVQILDEEGFGAAALGKSHQQLVASAVTKAVVHALEAVEVDEQHREDGVATADPAGHRPLQPFHEQHPVRQVRQGVVDGVVHQPLAGLAETGAHVVERLRQLLASAPPCTGTRRDRLPAAMADAATAGRGAGGSRRRLNSRRQGGRHRTRQAAGNELPRKRSTNCWRGSQSARRRSRPELVDWTSGVNGKTPADIATLSRAAQIGQNAGRSGSGGRRARRVSASPCHQDWSPRPVAPDRITLASRQPGELAGDAVGQTVADQSVPRISSAKRAGTETRGTTVVRPPARGCSCRLAPG